MTPSGRALGYPPALRLRKSSEVRRVQRGGRRRSTGVGTVCILDNALGHPRFGFAVSRKVGNAVARNRIKRRLREVFRHLRPRLPGIDVLLLARPAAADASFDDLSRAVHGALGPWIAREAR